MKGLSLEQSLAEYSKFVAWIDKYIPGKKGEKLKEFFGTRELVLSSAPYSRISGETGCYPGGYISTVNKLVECSLILNNVWNKFESEAIKYTSEELVTAAILCEVGKLGTNDDPFFLQNDNDWEIKNRGIVYKLNPNHPNLKYNDKALFIAQQAGITLTTNEFLAIKLYNSQMDTENNHYFRFDSKPPSNIAFILNQAYVIVNNTK